MKKNTVTQVLMPALVLLFTVVMTLSCNSKTTQKETEKPETEKILSPEDLYGNLFYDVMNTPELFGDGKLFLENKAFIDSKPKYEIAEILEKYTNLKDKDNSDTLKQFIVENFELPKLPENNYSDDSSIGTHITNLWDYLKREPDQSVQGTLIPLKHPYIVPGGRFREIYYWDSYFTMLGLQVDGKYDYIENMINNFSQMIDEIGFIPNGNRSYYISRSQPPFFSHMIELLAETKKDSTVYTSYLVSLEKEYSFWMNGGDSLTVVNTAQQHCVKLKDGEILNRYYDKRDTPRPEMYNQDELTASELKKHDPNADIAKLYRNIRSAAESGWDFSSRWFKDGKELYTIQTINIIPVDLNCLLYHLELTLAKAYALNGDNEKSDEFIKKSDDRKNTILKYFWDEKSGFFKDYNWTEQKYTDVVSLAGVYPLYVEIATQEQADKVADVIRKDFLKMGGVVTTLNDTGQQWDFPNGWAPLQWVTYSAMKNYDQSDIAGQILQRWTVLNENVYSRTHKMLEKYNVVDYKETGGGEYPNQDGFGWTNGVYKKLTEEKR